MRDVKWFVDQGLRLTPPDGPLELLDLLNRQALPDAQIFAFSHLLMDFQFGVDSPEQTDEVLFLAHFMRNKISLGDKPIFVERVRRHGLEVMDQPSSIPFYDASTLVGIAAVTQDPKWIDFARFVLPLPPPDTNIIDVLSEHGPLAVLRWLRALRFTAPHTTLTSNRALAEAFLERYMDGDCYGSSHYARTLHLYLSTLVFLPPAMRANMAWIAGELANAIAKAGRPLLVSAAVLISSNWDDITPARPIKQRKDDE